MAYAAVISLDQTIQRLLDSDPDRISVSSSAQTKLKGAQKVVESLKQVLTSFDRSCEVTKEFLDENIKNSFRTNRWGDMDRNIAVLGDKRGRNRDSLNPLDDQIRDAVRTFEDVIDFHVSDRFLSRQKMQSSRKRSSPVLFLDLNNDVVRRGFKAFSKAARKLEEKYRRDLEDLMSSEEEDDVVPPSYTDFGVDMIGFSNNFAEIKEQVLRKIRPFDFGVFSILGAAGTGRTAAARASFENLLRKDYDSEPEQQLDCGAWVTVGRNYEIKEIMATIIAQINEEKTGKLGEEEEDLYLYARLEGKRYMIVLDDVCDSHVWDELRSSFPKEDNGSLVLLTTELREVALAAGSLRIFEMSVFYERESWAIIEEGIFGKQESCPPHLEKAGKKIAKNCEGRRLVLAKVVLLLLKAERSAEWWNELAADEGNQIFMAADELSEIRGIENDMLQLPKSKDEASVVTEMIALSGYKEAIEEEVFPTTAFHRMELIHVLGMAGIGKTKICKKVVEDPDILGQFDHHVWLTLGSKYKSENIIPDILARVYSEIGRLDMETFLAKRWLIVLDDVWSAGIFYFLKEGFPIKGKVLVTTRQHSVMTYGGMPNLLRLLSKEESWCLFCRKVFGEGSSCPPELEKAGRKIVENCEGLPLLILTVAESLSKSEKMMRAPELWNVLAKEKENPLFLEAYDEISKVLYPSYEYLPQYLRACFLYMGAFPRNCEIQTTKLVNLLSAEGFLEANKKQTIEKVARSCLHELEEQNLIMFCEDGSSAHAKSYSLHSSFWHLSNSLAMKSKFLHVLDARARARAVDDDDDDDECKDVFNQRRLCIRNSIALTDNDVRSSMASSEAARSFLCFGPVNRYPVPIKLGLRLLKVLDALTIRFFEFPTDVVELVHLRYLALTCDGNLPSTISKLWFLQFLIVYRYLNVRSNRNSTSLPDEIWDMKELKHLQVSGSSLPDPGSNAHLPNLSTLLDVSVESCTEKILSRMPNLKKLRICIELAPRDACDKTFRRLNLKPLLRNLRSLKYVVVNPEFNSEVVCPFVPIPAFSSSLLKLKLSGFGYPWEHMSIIGKLQNLKILKLESYAFRGPRWDMSNDGFRKLEFLLIEDSNLEQWNVKRSSFPNLDYVILRHCYKLKELPFHLSNTITLIEVIDCNPLVVKWARQMENKELENVTGSRTIGIEAHSSWEGKG